MQIKQLTLIAFGPYKNKQVIDFTKLTKEQLFVISGATGAGKTTIFDAICFALYGTASGSDRNQSQMLRSQFADDDTHTAVDLTFSLHDKTYRVFRQLPHRKAGNVSRTGDRYELYELLGDQEIPIVDRQIVSEVNEKIESLIGLTVDQFRQIVMLPQGEFRKLLTSDTENKEKILRKLFHTEKYRLMNDRLKEKLIGLEQKYLSEKQHLNRSIEQLKTIISSDERSAIHEVLQQESYRVSQIVRAIEQDLHHLSEQIDHEQKVYERSLNNFNEKQQQYTNAKWINERFDLFDKKQLEWQQLSEQSEQFKQKEIQLQGAERASTLEAYEQQVIDREKECKAKESISNENKQAFIRAKEQLEQAIKQFELADKNNPQLEKITNQIARYEDFLPIVAKIDEEKNEIKAIEVEANQLENTIKDHSSRLIEIEKQIKKIETIIDRYSNELTSMVTKQSTRIELRNEYKLWKSYADELKELLPLEKELTEKQKAYEQIAEETARIENVWLQQQAAVLATHLREGDPCPVCGSTHHPRKFLDEASATITEDIESVQKIKEEQQRVYATLQGKVEAKRAQIEKLTLEIGLPSLTIEIAEAKLTEIEEKGKQLTEEINELEKKQIYLQQQNDQHKRLIEEEGKLQETKKHLEQKSIQVQTKLSAKKATLSERLRNIPSEFHQLATLEQKMKELTSLKQKLTNEWEEAQKQLKQAQIHFTTAETNEKNSKEQWMEAQRIVEKVNNLFLEKLKQQSFHTIEAYEQAKMSEAERTKLQREIEQFNEKKSTVQKEVESLQTELANKKREDLERLNEEVEQYKDRYERALHELNQTIKRSEQLGQVKNELIATKEAIETLERQLTTVQDVYDVLRGQNSKKLSFERYLQIDYLDQIIFAANSRFKTLTNGQFQLIRSDRQESHGRQSGLSIDVYDAYTGKSRHVNTLSGGEKFIASLSLALGMADVIQSYQGSIRIDTMFIDEGFGSLDEESLHKSIDALIQLQQSGRTIGVISHVDELKRMFPVMLQVTKEKDGHSKAKIVTR